MLHVSCYEKIVEKILIWMSTSVRNLRIRKKSYTIYNLLFQDKSEFYCIVWYIYVLFQNHDSVHCKNKMTQDISYQISSQRL